MQTDSVSQCPRKPPWSPHIIMARALHWLGFNLAQIDIASLKFQTKLATLPCILKASHLIWYSKRCYRYLTVSDPNKALLYLLCLLLRHETIISFSKLLVFFLLEGKCSQVVFFEHVPQGNETDVIQNNVAKEIHYPWHNRLILPSLLISLYICLHFECYRDRHQVKLYFFLH